MSTWCIADLHGHLEIWKKVKEIIGPNDTIYVLGDCVDRGPQSWETLKTVYNDPQAHLFKGNHEDMMVKAIQDYIDNGYQWEYKSYSLCAWNGGRDTLDEWERDPQRMEYFERLKELPTWLALEIKDKTFILCHAGFSPWFKEDSKEVDIPDDESLIWDREHYYSRTYLPQHMADVIVVHGHTPIHHLAADLNENWSSGAFWYCGDHKVCIDSGGFFSGEFILLNLDTLEDTVIALDGNDQMCI